jgi:hypothetical protein
MNELLPTLRESLRETAQRRRRRRRQSLAPTLIAAAAVVVALVVAVQHDPTQSADEVPATPTPVATALVTAAPTATSTPSFTPTPTGSPRATPKLDSNDLHATPVAADDPSLEAALSLLNDSHQVVRAWEVRGLKGHVLLTRKGAQWCLSAPDPLADHPDAERGVSCGPDSRFQRLGAYVGLSSPDGSSRISITVKPDLKTIRIEQR